ncbi:sensor histidine kinase [Desnuesiella massiliensis]|uniref:sensor histidine kinase n=1 Tax=Desnuesiella massiliensis TaxID=1650662 RepID=UPI0006E170D4|nr:GHKL domain-containing protein [Desnuesiella massiliensis]
MDRFITFIFTFLELSSVMLLWSKFHKDKEKVLLKSLGIILGIALVVSTNVKLPLLPGLVINYLLLIFSVFFVFKKDLNESIIEFCIVILITMLMQLILTLLANIMGMVYTGPDNQLQIKSGFIINLILFIFSSFIYKYISYEDIYKKNKLQFRIIYFYVINLVAYIILSRFIWQYNNELFLNNIAFFLIFLFAVFILSVLFLKDIIRINEDKKNIELYERYSEVAENLLTDVRRRQHDFKNHLNTIYGMAQVTDEREIKDKISKYIESLNYSFHSMDKIIQVENKIVSGIIFCKLQEAYDKGIDFQYLIQGNIEEIIVKDYELSEIIYNLLDNAFDAVLEIKDEYKKVVLSIIRDESSILIEVTNSSLTIKPENINKIFKKGFSTKGSLSRGFGLYNVKKIVDFYGGKIEISLENNQTTFKILF